MISNFVSTVLVDYFSSKSPRVLRSTDQLSRLHMILKPFMLRRIKSDVENELSDKVKHNRDSFPESSPLPGFDKGRNLSLPYGQPAIQFCLPEAILN